MQKTKTKTVEVQVQYCDKCGKELYELDHRGEPPFNVSGVYYADDGHWSPTPRVYCESTCIPQDGIDDEEPPE